MSKIDITAPASSGGPVNIPDGVLQTAAALNSTLQTVVDNLGNSSTLLLSTTEAQVNSILRINTNNAEILDIQDSSGNNRFNVNRSTQKINLDFASKPSDQTTIIGAIRTSTDGTNLADVMTFRENGNVAVLTNLGVGIATPTTKLDVNGNIKTNNIFQGFTSVAASGTQIVLTIDSTPFYVVTGSGGQTIKLPDATTLPNGINFYFNNNQSSGAITVNNNSNTLVASVPSGGDTVITLLSNATAAGSWERHELAPSNVSWSTNTLDYAGSITSATWNGVSIADNRIASAATWNAKQDSTITTNRQTASYVLVLTDASKLVEMNVATANTLTVPLNGTVPFATGTQILISQYGAGQTTVTATGGVTIRSAGGKLKLNSQYSGATLIKIATDEWYLFGDITT
jgi:hypothetical protein